MFTRCPDCETVFELEARHIALAAGVVRCGHCNKVFNSLGLLFPDHPARPDSSPEPTGGMPPALDSPRQGSLDLSPAAPNGSPDHEPGPKLVFDELVPEPAPAARPSWVWPAALALLGLVFIGHWFLLPQTARSTATGWIGFNTTPGGLANPADTVQIVSRDMHPHPGLPDALIVSATLANPADHAVEYPVLELRLFDGSHQIIGVRRFEPSDYLDPGTELENGLRAGVLMPILMEIAAPGGQPEGFEFRFH